MSQKPHYKHIPTKLTEEQFNQFFCPYLSQPVRGPKLKLPVFKVFNYIVNLIHTGVQWCCLPIEKNQEGMPEIHYTNLFRRFQIWSDDGSLDRAFEASVCLLNTNDLLDVSVLHGDGSNTVAKKGGDNLGYNGHKHFKGEKVVAITDRNANIISPFITAPGNRNETILLKDSLTHLSRVAGLAGISLDGSIMSLDSGYDSVANRKLIFNRQMTPNIKEKAYRRKHPKRGRKRIYSKVIFKERFQTVERAFAWEDKFKRLLMRFEVKSSNHFGMKILAFTMINLRHFC